MGRVEAILVDNAETRAICRTVEWQREKEAQMRSGLEARRHDSVQCKTDAILRVRPAGSRADV
jgi:hypothetical protein